MKNTFIVALLLVLVGIFTVNTVGANPSHFIKDKSASATTSVSYIGVGNNHTDTLDTLVSGNTAAVDTGVLLIQSTASNTASIIDVTLYYSDDAVDWFAESATVQTPGTAGLGRYDHASTTVAHRFTGNTTASTTRFTLDIGEVPTRYVKAIVSVPTGAASSSIWTEWVAKKESI